MTLNLIIALFVIGVALWHFKWHASAIGFIAVSAAAYVAIASGKLPDYLMNRLQSPYVSHLQTPLEDNMVFVVLGMGTQTITEGQQKVVEPLAFSYGSIFAAIKFYRQCELKALHCRIIASGGDVSGTGMSEAASIARELEAAGIDAASITIEEQSRNTWQNAQFTAAILRDPKPSKVVLLQAGPLMKRSLVYFAHFGVMPEPVAAAYLTTTHTDFASVGLSFLAVDLALHEEAGMWRYKIYNLLGWNPPVQPPISTS